MSVPAPAAGALPPFRNEPYTDFADPARRAAMIEALEAVRSRFGNAYDLWIAGGASEAPARFESLNPSRPSEVVGVHQKASAAQAREAVEAAHAYFPQWAAVSIQDRAAMLLGAARILRERKMEFDAWLVFEAGKTWIEAEADVSEAIDFCEYYARLALRLCSPEALVQLPGERGHLRYLPLGAGVIIPPWNFPLAILVGMTVAALVAGNTVVIKPSSDTPTIAAKFVEVLRDAGFPDRSYNLLTGSGAEVGDTLVEHPRTRFVSFTGSKAVGLRIVELASRTAPGQIWIKRVAAEMGGKDAIIVDAEADLDAAAAGVLASAFGYQGQKCSACSRAIVDESIYEPFLDRLVEGAARIRVGPADDPDVYMGPVINARARQTILGYIEQGKREGRLVAGGNAAPGEGYFLEPTVIADVPPTAVIFREEIFGPVLAVTKARGFQHALDLANDSEYGLTGAVYTSNPEKIRQAEDSFFVGNLYINRKCTGAMAGAHPFGGFNMSGTNSKAGGPDYLLQFVQGKSIARKL